MYFFKQKMIGVALKNGQIRIAKIGEPYFPEPLHPKTMVIGEKEELFLTGVYPQYNTVLLNYEKYKKIMNVYNKYYAYIQFWKINTIVFLFLLLLICTIYLYQMDVFVRLWKIAKEKK